MLHLFSLVVAASTLILILAGGFVTSTGSGLAVPDWPNTYGWFMFAFPLEKMVGGIYWEHGHRLIASTVGFLILVLAFWLRRAEPRRSVRRLGYIALAAVITQGILGGITVLWFLPDPISIAHAGLAQIVFCLTVAIALFTSRGWREEYAALKGCATTAEDRATTAEDRATTVEDRATTVEDRATTAEGRATEGRATIAEGTVTADDRRLQCIALATTVLIYAQIVVGATMRHTEAGLAIPDFPLAFGRLIPTHWDAKIAVNFAHRVGAAVVAAHVLATVLHVFARARGRRELMRPALLLLVLLCVQVTLGAFVVWSGKHFVINSVHVATGASVLGTSLVLTLRAHRSRFGQPVALEQKAAA